MASEELYHKGARVWIPDAEEVWIGAVLTEDYKPGQSSIKLEVEDSLEARVVTVKGKLPPLRNPDILIGENDLTSMSYLNEPEVLYNLQVRFVDRNSIYTYCGIVLVAINPYDDLPIYGNEIIQAYNGMDANNLDPHIYAVAEEAFKQMSRFEQNQSIIVSGESGAGKTVSAKYAMRYFATVGGSSLDETQVEKKVLASNPIMEAIGNAKTTRNDNSSRFGKYIEIDFRKDFKIIGAQMRTYLLEKSRVVFQASDERNYHVFYQMCAARDTLPGFELAEPESFLYLNHGECTEIAGIDDRREMDNTRDALKTLGMNRETQDEIFRVFAAILHLGNICLTERSSDSSQIPRDDTALLTFCSLLGINVEQTMRWLCNRQIQTVGETLNKPLTVVQACFSRDALAKHIYSQVFQYIVVQVNQVLATSDKVTSFIGVLDIYGFETFEINSFEQFCINYANEKLQQQFNLHVFKLEQEEYIREQIQWNMIDFCDNQPCIDLIEAKLGVLDLLDEECKVPNGSDQNWCTKLYDRLGKKPHFSKPKTSRTAFTVEHFADMVTYETEGFLDKNRDAVLETQLGLLRDSQNAFVSKLFAEKSDKTSGATKKSTVTVRAGAKQPKSGGKSSKQTVGSQFRESLNSLMTTLFATTPHYVRCIKPNDEKAAFTFDSRRAVQQLRACGVLETIRISAAGYPSRWTYQEFFQRYRVLCEFRKIKRNDLKFTCEQVLIRLINDDDKYQFGKTKIFFRAGQVAYLEKLRGDKLRACGIMIQKHVKGWIYRKKYLRIKKAALVLQTHARGLLARRLARFLRQTRAAVKIQAAWRGATQRRVYTKQIRAIVSIQSYARGVLARRRFTEMLRDVKATIIQSHVKRWMAQRRYKIMLRGVILVQSHYRRRKARALFKVLKVEARSVDHIKKVNLGLENKIIQLQQRLDESKKASRDLETEASKVKTLQGELESLKGSDQQLKTAANKITDLEEKIIELTKQLESERQEKQDLISEKQELLLSTNQASEKLQGERDGLQGLNGELQAKVEDLEAKLAQQQSDFRTELKALLDQERQAVLSEVAVEREHHQRLVKEHGKLQQKMENLIEERHAGRGPVSPLHYRNGRHVRHSSDVSSISLDSSVPDSGILDELSDFRRNGSFRISHRSKAEHRGESVEPGQVELPVNQPLSQSSESLATVKQKDDNLRPEDSVSPTPSRDGKAPAQQANEHPTPVMEQINDLGTMLKLQGRVKDLEKERSQLMSEIDMLRKRPRSQSQFSDIAVDQQKSVELEMENSRLKENLEKLRKAVTSGDAKQEVNHQLSALNEELERRRDECLQLKSVLAARAKESIELAKQSYGGDPNLLNEDGELAVAYQTQKDINRVLQRDLEQEKTNNKHREAELRKQIESLKQDNEKQQNLIGQSDSIGEIKDALENEKNMTVSPEKALEQTIQYEIQRLLSENLDLREQIEKLDEKVRKLKKTVKVYASRLKEAGNDKINEQVTADLERELESQAGGENLGQVKHQRVRQYTGILEYRPEDEAKLIKRIILDLRPRIAITLIPTLPAYVIFMCLRHTDYLNEDSRCRTLLTGLINAIRKVAKTHQDDLETFILWLSNTCRFLHLLKQYSGEQQYQNENTETQNSHCLRNFDLSEYRNVLKDLAIWLYQGLVKVLRELLHPIIVSALLQYEGIQGLTSKPSIQRQRSSSVESPEEELISPAESFNKVLEMLSNWVNLMRTHGIDALLVDQIFKQTFHYIVATATNTLLLRKDMCNWSKGMQIRYNLSTLEQWLRDNRLHECGAMDTMEPLIQATQLLQARKTMEDVDSVCDMCSHLSVAQIIKLLNLYTPVDEYEERVPISFIRRIQHTLKERRKDHTTSPQNLLIDSKHTDAVDFTYTASSIGLESVDIPNSLKLDFLVRV